VLTKKWEVTAPIVRANADRLLRLHRSDKVVKPLIAAIFNGGNHANTRASLRHTSRVD
jgi:hypothetical protein